MRYSYNIYGWFNGEVSDDIIFGSSSFPPPTETETLKANYTGNEWVLMEYVAPPPIISTILATPTNKTKWFIDLGPFYDRFGGLKIAILTSSDAGVKAILADLNIREYVDLERKDVLDALNYIKMVIPSLTDEIIQTILKTPVTQSENYALRVRLYGGN